VAELLRYENELPTLKLSLGVQGAPTGPTSTAQLEVDRGTRVVGQLSLRPEDLNLAFDFDPAAYRYSEPPFAIAERLRPTVRRLLELAMEDQQTLWLELASPVGYLAALPWETMLESVIGLIPVLRIPNFSLFTPLDVDRIDIVVCLSEPGAKSPFNGVDFLRRFIPSLLAPLPLETCVHVFTDAETYSQMDRLPQGELGSHIGRVVLHDPARAPTKTGMAGEGSIGDSAGCVSNPWLLWIIEEMRESTAEVVHFITHGYVQSGQSALALAESPTRRDASLLSRFVGPNQIAAFLTQLGAWGVGFSSPPQNYSAMGLRQLFDDVARLRAGPILHHDAKTDPLADELADTYAGLFMGRSPRYRRAVSMYAHPGLLAGNAPFDGSQLESFADNLVSRPLGRLKSSTEAPAWVTSTQRYLEQAVASRFPEQAQPTSEVQRASGKGVEDVLKFVDGILRNAGDTDR
jgi:hypothetical protein